MPVFKKHYTREEARALLPKVLRWLDELTAAKAALEQSDQQLARLLQAGQDAGGEIVNRQVRCISALQGALIQFRQREIQIKDLERGLIDFPAFVGGKEVFLCWEKGEDDIEFWHDLSGGYAGREPLG